MLLSAALTLAMTQNEKPSIAIIPEPVKMTVQGGNLVLNKDTRIVVLNGTDGIGRLLQSELRPSTGHPLDLGSRPVKNSIELSLDPQLANLGDEGYMLTVTKDKAQIKAFKSAGVFYGVQTLRQLLPSESLRKAKVEGVEWSIPCVQIEDIPRFAWRGGQIDVGRHFMPKEFILKYIDLLAFHKFNTLHLHLTEDQGWRIEIKKYPKLTEIGSARKETMAGPYSDHKFDGKPHKGFFTQEDIREIVAYAADRFVTVMPEIEMPGHSQAAIAAYPELGNTGKQLEVFTSWGVNENVFNVEDSTISFLQDVLTEVMTLFPSKFIHIGGDECPKKQWQESASAQAKMKSLGIKTEHELQSWFIKQIDRFLDSKGRRLVGWDEILEGGLAPGATVMSWRGEAGGIQAAKEGHDVIMTPTDTCYFDYYQSKDTKKEPLAIGGFLPLETVYRYEPLPKALTEAEAKHVLGVEFQLWTEYIPDPKQSEYMAFPRACAMSEVAWSAKGDRNYTEFLSRLNNHFARLKAMDVNYRSLDR